MIRWFIDLLYGATPATFGSSFGLDESVSRLREATVQSSVLAFLTESAVGTVTAHEVSLNRVKPLMRQRGLYFIGHFEGNDEKVVLVGRFTTHWFQKAFKTIWFSGVALWTILISIAVITQRSSGKWWFPLFGVGMACVGAADLRFAKWRSRTDAEWLSYVIQAALSGTSPAAAQKPLARSSGIDDDFG